MANTMMSLPALLTLVGAGGALGYNNGVAVTPPMGWNSWNHFAGGVSAEVLVRVVSIPWPPAT